MFRKKRYLDWDSYKGKVDFMDTFNWQQSVRKANMASRP